MQNFGILKKSQTVLLVDDRHWLSASAAPNVFTPEECTKMIEYWDEEEALDARTRVSGSAGNSKGDISDTRVGKLQWLDPNDDEYYWLFTRLAQAVLQINRATFGILVDGMVDKIQLTRYLPGDKYMWHEDAANGIHRRRKLSFTLQLSDPGDFEGGGLEFASGEVQPPGTDLGALVVFPSFLMHQAIEVTKGERWALVGWFSGPEWR